MKKRMLAALAFVFLLAGCSGPTHPQTPSAAEPEGPAALETPAGTEAPAAELPAASAQPAPDYEPEPDFVPNAVDLYFPSNPTTGYNWTAEVETPGIVELDEMYFSDAKPGIVGAGGVQWYRIRGASEGITSVTFRYARPWEDSALTTYVYRLQVDAKRSVLIWGVEVDGA
ncbi:MAG: protease inhibitor I42 family protein [Eubacteriales bacterium]|nr:protease inhibitor I42 family protein [Eubacteriales bacterium]